MKLNLDYLFDTNVFEVNLLPNHSIFNTINDNENCTNEIKINDSWKYQYFKNYDESILNFVYPDQSIDNLKNIEVPLSVELQGIAKPQYVNTQYPWDGYNDSKLGEKINGINQPVIGYYRDLEINEDDLTKEIIINFKGFETALYLLINGEFVGYSENIYVDSEFNITKYLKLGKNRISAIIFKFSTASWFLDQDFFRFSGIFRDVSIFKYHRNYLQDIDLNYDIVDFNNGIVKAKLSFKGAKNLNKNISISDGKAYLIKDVKTNQDSIDLLLTDVKLWSSEKPNLYNLKIELFNLQEKLSTIYAHIGFKEVKIEDSIIKYNQKRLIINGVNRHEWNMYRGRNVTLDDMIFDVELLKQNNFNAVRLSHYPNANEFYDLCDEYGLMMMDENCLETHGSFGYSDSYHMETNIPGSDNRFKNYLCEKISRMYMRDKLHPSIFMFSLGNESGNGEVFMEMKKTLKELNPKILVHYEGPANDFSYKEESDVHSRMYWNPTQVKEFIPNNLDKPFIHCEFEHAMGNSLGNFDEYRELIDLFPTYQGGFIWDYIDQGLVRKENGKELLSYGGDFSDKPTDYNFCCNGLLTANRSEAKTSAKLHTAKYFYSPLTFKMKEDEIEIKNNQLFSNTSLYKFEFQILINGEIKFIDSFKANINPGQSLIYLVPDDAKASFPLNQSDIVYQIIVKLAKDTSYAKKNHIVVQDELILIQSYKENALEIDPTFKVVEGHYNISVTGKNFSYLFTKSKFVDHMPGLLSIKYNDEEYLAAPTYPTIFRAPTDNDYGANFPYRYSQLFGMSKYLFSYPGLVNYEIKKDSFLINYKYILNFENNDFIEVVYYCLNNGEIKVTLKMDSLKSVAEISQFALVLPLNKQFKKITYFAKGKDESYPDRKAGLLSGIYSSNINKEYTNYIHPQECGSHEDTRFVKINNLKIVCLNNYFKVKYLPYSDFMLSEAKHVYELNDSHVNYLTIAGFNRGVGGDDSWMSDIHNPYKLKTNHPYEFNFLVKYEK